MVECNSEKVVVVVRFHLSACFNKKRESLFCIVGGGSLRFWVESKCMFKN